MNLTGGMGVALDMDSGRRDRDIYDVTPSKINKNFSRSNERKQ
jgi:hypothetical protein